MWDNLPNEFEEVREFELGVVDLNNLSTNDFARHVEYVPTVEEFRIKSNSRLK